MSINKILDEILNGTIIIGTNLSEDACIIEILEEAKKDIMDVIMGEADEAMYEIIASAKAKFDLAMGEIVDEIMDLAEMALIRFDRAVGLKQDKYMNKLMISAIGEYDRMVEKQKDRLWVKSREDQDKRIRMHIHSIMNMQS